MGDGPSVTERVRAALDASDYPELAISELVRATGARAYQVRDAVDNAEDLDRDPDRGAIFYAGDDADLPPGLNRKGWDDTDFKPQT